MKSHAPLRPGRKKPGKGARLTQQPWRPDERSVEGDARTPIPARYIPSGPAYRARSCERRLARSSRGRDWRREDRRPWDEKHRGTIMVRAGRHRYLAERGFVGRGAAGRGWWRSRGKGRRGGEKESVRPAFRCLNAEEGLDRRPFTRR